MYEFVVMIWLVCIVLLCDVRKLMSYISGLSGLLFGWWLLIVWFSVLLNDSVSVVSGMFSLLGMIGLMYSFWLNCLLVSSLNFDVCVGFV